jgi:hypothetical protein
MLFGGLLRVGQLDFVNPQESIDMTARSPGNVAFVQYTGTRGGAHGHSYFRENPAVSSDLVLTLRYERDPGVENGRPLANIQGHFWAIDDDYPRATARAP